MAVDVHALVAALPADPEAKEAVRRELLTDELLALPALMGHLTAQVDKLAVTQGRTEQRLDQLTAQVTKLAEAQVRTEERLDQLTVQVTKLADAQARTEERLSDVRTTAERAAGRIGHLWGLRYQADALAATLRIAGAVGAPPTALHRFPHDQLVAHLHRAVEAGTLTPEVADDIRVGNGVLVWDRRPAADPLFYAVEVSGFVDALDVERVTQRAAALAKTGTTVRAVVLGDVLGDDAMPAVDAGEVIWQRIPPRRLEPPQL